MYGNEKCTRRMQWRGDGEVDGAWSEVGVRLGAPLAAGAIAPSWSCVIHGRRVRPRQVPAVTG